MATLALQIIEGNVSEFVKETKENFETNPLTNLLVNADICIFKDKEGEVVIYNLIPVVNEFILLFPMILFSVVIFVFNLNPFLYLIPAIYTSIILMFYSDYFLYLIYKIGLKKANINSKAKRINRDLLIKRMVKDYEQRTIQ